MPAYFASDVHLRLDRPERGHRFARWVGGLEPDDTLTIGGDLCDFWLASRQRRAARTECPGLKALADFRRRGGALTLLAGNHDTWLGPYYEDLLGVPFVAEPLDVRAFGLRLRLVHGHRLGGRRAWKGWMETHAFLSAFERAPDRLAAALDHRLDERNDRRRAEDDARYLPIFRRFAEASAGVADLVVIGHIHQPRDEADRRARLVVPGGWHTRTSYLKVDATGATLVVEPDAAPIPC